MIFISYEQLAKDVESFCHKLKKPDVVIGIPRSGMIPATMMATYWDVPLTTVPEFIEGRIYGDDKVIKNVLVVDDSMLYGITIRHAQKELKNLEGRYNIIYAVIYDSTMKKEGLDEYIQFRTIREDRFFQWNIFKHKELIKASLSDIDGVLCRPPTHEEYIHDDGKYIEFLKNTEPWHIPTDTVGALVTCRLERYRKQTELWLNRHGVKYDNLIMMQYKTGAERRRAGNHAQYKADVYKESNALLFIEDEPGQAQEINRLSHRPVLCVGNWRLYNENS